METKLVDENEQVSIIIFQVGSEEFVISLLDVKEIIQTGYIRRLPKSKDFIEGIYNYRGNIIHIINLKKKLNLEDVNVYNKDLEDKAGQDGKRFIIIVNIGGIDVGFSVDRILNISNIEISKVVGLSPIIQTGISNIDYINGIVKFEEKPRIFINLHTILSDAEKESIKKDQENFL